MYESLVTMNCNLPNNPLQPTVSQLGCPQNEVRA
jgi:hypothetical protein